MPDKLLKQLEKVAWTIAGYGFDSIVTRTATTSRKKPKPNEPVELTKFMLAPGAWIIAGQASFQVHGANDSHIDYDLSLGYTSGTTFTKGSHAFMRIPGSAYGSPIVIDALVLDHITTVKLLYEIQPFWDNSTSYPPSTTVPGQILIAVKASNLLLFKP